MRPRSPRFSFAKLAPSFHRQQHIRSTSMSEIPGDLKFMKSNEWARVEGDGKVTVGISDHAQGLLGDLVSVDLPAAGDRAATGTASAVMSYKRSVGNDGGSTGRTRG